MQAVRQPPLVVALLVALLLTAPLPRTHAGCRRIRADVSPAQLSHRHQPLRQKEQLPANFSWNDVNGTGVSMLVGASLGRLPP